MDEKFDIEKLNKMMRKFMKEPSEAIIDYFKKTYKKQPELNFILKTIFKELHDESECGQILYHLLKLNFGGTYLSSKYVINAIQAGYSERMIIRLINIAIECRFDMDYFLNNPSEELDIMYALIYSYKYRGNITSIYKLLLKNGYKNKTNIDGTLIDAIDIMEIDDYCSKIIPDKKEFIEEYNKTNKDSNYLIQNDLDYTIKNKNVGKLFHGNIDLEFIERLGEFIKNEEYAQKYSLAKKYYANMYISMDDNKFTLVEGKDEGVNLITEFGLLLLSNSNFNNINKKRILKTSYNKLLNNCTSIGSLVNDLILLMRKCAEHNIILYIEDFFEIYKRIGVVGYSYLMKEELCTFIEFLVEKKNLTLVATIKKGESVYFHNSYTSTCANLVTTNEGMIDLLVNYIEKKINDKKIIFTDNKTEQLFMDLLYCVINENNRTDKDEKTNIVLVDYYIDKLSNYLNCINEVDIIDTFKNIDNLKENTYIELNKIIEKYYKSINNNAKKKIKKAGE